MEVNHTILKDAPMDTGISAERGSFLDNVSQEMDVRNTSTTEDVDLNEGVLEGGTFELIVMLLNKYGMPVLIFGGIFGNIICFTVFVNTHLRLLSCYVYLAFLSIADTVFLLCLTMNWLGWWQVYTFHTNGWCQTVIFVSYVSSFLSTWGVVSLTIERYIIVFHPLKKQMLCTRRIAIIVVVVLTVAACLFYSFAPITHGIVFTTYFGPVCMSYQHYDVLLRIMTGIDTLITLIVPAVTIVTLNIAIVVKIWDFFMGKSNRQRQEGCKSLKLNPRQNSDQGQHRNTGKSQYHARTSHHCKYKVPKTRHGSRRNLQLRTTRSLLVVSTVFVILNLPSHSLRIHMTVHFLLSTDTPYTDELQRCMQVLQFLSYLNYSANFLLYSASNKSFLRALRRLVIRWKKSLRSALQSLCGKTI